MAKEYGGDVFFGEARFTGLNAIADVIHPYLTQAEVIHQAAEEYSLAQFTPLIKKIAAKWLAWQH